MTRDLEATINQIMEIAEGFGLEPIPMHFDVVPAEMMYEFGAYGLPGRFSHWTHGKEYHRMKASYDHGLSRIYELVVNTDPCHAFLMENNTMLQNVLVAAHVVGHSDFFKNNAYFQRTNRKMHITMSQHAERIEAYEFEHGERVVEEFLDRVLSIESHVDPHPRHTRVEEKFPKVHETEYDDLWGVNHRVPKAPKKVPPEPDRDLLLFLIEHAPDLEDWQRDIIGIVRDEMLYFVPQMQTKIMNEGWASYWHLRIMRELDLDDAEYTDFADMHSGVVAGNRRTMNPYLVGLKIFEDIEKRWDKPTDEEKKRFGRVGSQGRAKIFDVRATESDASFLRNYLSQDVVDDCDLYIYAVVGEPPFQSWEVMEKKVEPIRDMIVQGMTNFGRPLIWVDDGNYAKRHELYLRHQHEGRDLDSEYTLKTLVNIGALWGRPVHLETMSGDAPILVTHEDGEVRTSTIPKTSI